MRKHFNKFRQRSEVVIRSNWLLLQHWDRGEAVILYNSLSKKVVNLRPRKGISFTKLTFRYCPNCRRLVVYAVVKDCGGTVGAFDGSNWSVAAYADQNVVSWEFFSLRISSQCFTEARLVVCEEELFQVFHDFPTIFKLDLAKRAWVEGVGSDKRALSFSCSLLMLSAGEHDLSKL
ncbi:hypothetical protein TorRG33x02_354220 [Trema orientale]|uniref:Uncharacterized protein n=1 Tax=Trema orientale TaxID=63057 RepID=A0A2P5ABI3_TREOI|nr:hypothetical protein TorRG33x02_354220 [Trema orientale]